MLDRMADAMGPSMGAAMAQDAVLIRATISTIDPHHSREYARRFSVAMGAMAQTEDEVDIWVRQLLARKSALMRSMGTAMAQADDDVLTGAAAPPPPWSPPPIAAGDLRALRRRLRDCKSRASLVRVDARYQAILALLDYIDDAHVRRHFAAID